MALDHSRNEGLTGQVDHSCAGRHCDIRPGRNDLVAINQHRPAFVRTRIDAVEYLRGLEEDRFGGGRHRERCNAAAMAMRRRIRSSPVLPQPRIEKDP